MKISVKIVFLVLLSFFSFISHGRDIENSSQQMDSGVFVQHGKFDQGLIDAFREDSAFNYELPNSARPGILKLIFTKFFEWLVLIFGNEFFAWLVVIVLIIIGVVGLGFAFYGLFGIGKTFPVYARENGELDYTVKEENIHEIDFQEEIENAVAKKEFKKAVRLVYLYGLKILSDYKIIEWSPSKTNHDYLYEIQSEDQRNQFSTICYFYEYVWYGDFQAGLTQYEEINATLKNFRNNLSKDV